MCLELFLLVFELSNFLKCWGFGLEVSKVNTSVVRIKSG